MQPTPWYEPVLNERNLHISMLKGRIGEVLSIRGMSDIVTRAARLRGGEEFEDHGVIERVEDSQSGMK